MKITIIHETEDGQQVETFDGIEMIEYEDQIHLRNGKWLHLYPRDKKSFSIEIDENDWFRINQW